MTTRLTAMRNWVAGLGTLAAMAWARGQPAAMARAKVMMMVSVGFMVTSFRRRR